MAKALTLIDLEDFLPLLQKDGEDDGIENDAFIEEQYERFIQITSGNMAIDHIEHHKLEKFKGFVLKEDKVKKNKLRRNYLFNLIYNKYMFDIQSIKSQNVFNNFYFNNRENGIVKQFFVAAVQVLFTILLLMQIILNFDDIDFDNTLNLILALIVMYLSFVLIKPSLSSIVDDLNILGRYFHLAPLNTILNVTANIVLALILPWVTFFVILYSETLTDIVLNATAIAFIIELDDEAAGEVDLENWFVTTTTSFEDIFKRIIEPNDDIITFTHSDTKDIMFNIQDKINKVHDALKDRNTTLEYSETTICQKIRHMMLNIILFILTPILCYRHPWDIMRNICKSKKESSMYIQSKRKQTKEATYSQIEKNVEKEAEDASLHSPLKSNHDTESNRAQIASKTEKEDHSATNQLIAKALELNVEGNYAANDHKFNDAHHRYQEAIDLLLEPCGEMKEEESEVFNYIKEGDVFYTLSILYFNNGFALYQRGKQSWIAELITNESGHPFTNYKGAIRSFEKCKFYLCAYTFGASMVDIHLEQLDDPKTALCDKFISDIHYDLYEFNESEEYYIKYQEKCKQKSDNKRLSKIQKKKEAFGDGVGYLEILNKARVHLFSGDTRVHLYTDDDNDKCNHFEDKDCVLIKLDNILENQDKYPLFKENDGLVAKYYWFRGQCYDYIKHLTIRMVAKTRSIFKRKLAENRKQFMSSQEFEELKSRLLMLESKIKQANDNSENDLDKASQLSDDYGWYNFESIATYTNRIEFEPHQSYYYYIRGSTYNYLKLYQEAANDFKKAIELNERNPLFHVKLFEVNNKCKELNINITIDMSTSNAFISEAMVSYKGINCVITILALLSEYVDACALLKDDNGGMSEQEYKRVLAQLNFNDFAREVFEGFGTFDTLCDDKGVMRHAQFESLIDKFSTEYTFDKFGLGYFRDFSRKIEQKYEAQKHLDKEHLGLSAFNNMLLHSEAVFISKEILMRIQKLFDEEEYLTKKEWENFVNILPKYIIDLCDEKGISKGEFKHGAYKQYVLEQHGITFDAFADDDGLIDMKEFATIPHKIIRIIASKLKTLYCM